MNRIVLIGRLTRDPELRYTPSGQAVVNFGLAVDRDYKNAQGEKEADFINIVAWRQKAEFAANYLQKGRLIALEGRLQIRSYTTQDGQKRTAAEVVADNFQPLERAKETTDEQIPVPEPPFAQPTAAEAEFDESDPFVDE